MCDTAAQPYHKRQPLAVVCVDSGHDCGRVGVLLCPFATVRPGHTAAGTRIRAAAPVAAPGMFLRRYLTDFELENGQVEGV